MDWLNRLRTSYGFGVHSPFAFSLITDTLRLRGPYAFYAYSSLPDPTARLIYRLAARLNPARLDDFSTGFPLPPYVPAKSSSLQVPTPTPAASSPTLYVIAPGGDISALPEALSPGDSVILIDPAEPTIQLMVNTLNKFGHGMSFTARRSLFSSPSAPRPYALFCLLPHLPLQHFHLNT